MPFEISIKESQQKVLQKLPDVAKISSAHLQKAIHEAGQYVWQKVIEKTPASTGTLKKSIRRDLYPTYAQIYPSIQYGLYVHEGTQPHWPPLAEIRPGGSIYRWAQKKGIPPFLVARAIAAHGTKPQPWMQEVARTEWKAVQDIFIEALEQALENL